MELSDIELRIAQALVSDLDDEQRRTARSDFSRLADDYESLALMNELPHYATPAQAAMAEVPGVETLGSGETAAALGRVYRRAIQLAGQ